MPLKEAIFKVQGQVSKVHKNGNNPHTNSKFPTLESVLDVLNDVIQENGLVLTQSTQYKEFGWVLTTDVSTKDGRETMSMDTPLLGLEESKNKMQALGAAMTYARRYALMALFKLAPTDDDAHAAGASDITVVKEKPREIKNHAPQPKDLKIAEGKYAGKRVSEIPRDDLLAYIAQIETATKAAGKTTTPKWFNELKTNVGL